MCWLKRTCVSFNESARARASAWMRLTVPRALTLRPVISFSYYCIILCGEMNAAAAFFVYNLSFSLSVTMSLLLSLSLSPFIFLPTYFTLSLTFILYFFVIIIIVIIIVCTSQLVSNCQNVTKDTTIMILYRRTGNGWQDGGSTYNKCTPFFLYNVIHSVWQS